MTLTSRVKSLTTQLTPVEIDASGLPQAIRADR